MTEAEWDVIRTLWDGAPLRASEVAARLSDRAWSPSTVRTLLTRLERKSLVRAERGRSAKLYTPLISRSDSRHTEARLFLDRVYEGDVPALLTHFLTHSKLKKSVLNDLQALIKQRKKGR